MSCVSRFKNLTAQKSKFHDRENGHPFSYLALKQNELHTTCILGLKRRRYKFN